IASQCPAPAVEAGTPKKGDGGGEDAAAPPPPPSQPQYQRVVRLYANAFLHTGTPLHTMALAFSGQAGAAIKYGGKSLTGGGGGGGGGSGDADRGSGGGGGFEESWMVTAAAIVSNKVAGWVEQLTGLGDRLFESDNVAAAHAMFLVAGMQVDLPTTKGARLILPGVDHRKPAHRSLRTAEATDAVHILEVLEVASKSGGRSQNSAVQGHKLRLAMRLADLGFLQKAYDYAHSAQAEVAAMGGRSQGGSQQRSPYSPQFITALNEFEDRACAALGLEANGAGNAAGDEKKERTGGAGSAAAGAGGWLLNRVTNLVKTSATPGPAPTPSRSRSSSGASMHQGQQSAAAMDPGHHNPSPLQGAPPVAAGGGGGGYAGRSPFAGPPRPGGQASTGIAASPFKQQQPQQQQLQQLQQFPPVATQDAGGSPPPPLPQPLPQPLPGP
ncbi:unnamed protein product, partial [Ectocarpus sp. 12 AP-2014]